MCVYGFGDGVGREGGCRSSMLTRKPRPPNPQTQGTPQGPFRLGKRLAEALDKQHSTVQQTHSVIVGSRQKYALIIPAAVESSRGTRRSAWIQRGGPGRGSFPLSPSGCTWALPWVSLPGSARGAGAPSQPWLTQWPLPCSCLGDRARCGLLLWSRFFCSCGHIPCCLESNTLLALLPLQDALGQQVLVLTVCGVIALEWLHSR